MSEKAERAVRWAIVGSGHICNDFCLALRSLPREQHELVAVAARSLESAEKFASRHGVKKAYGSYEDIAKDPDVEIVYIGTIHPTHVPLSLMMLNAGKHVLCEKPMSMSLAGARKVIECAEKNKLLFVEGSWSRFFPAYEQLRHELAVGTIGDVRGVTASFGLTFDWDNNERMSKKELGGGVTLDLLCYPVQLACLVFGGARPEKIQVHGALQHTGVDRCASVTLCYSNGCAAQLASHGDSRLPNNAVIYGTKGIIEIPTPMWCPTELKTPSQNYEYPLPDTPEPTRFTNSAGFVYEIESIRKALLNGATECSQISHAHSLLIAEILEEIIHQLGVQYDAE